MNSKPFSNLTTNQKWAAGILAAIVVLCGVFSLTAASFQMGRMGSTRQGYMQGLPQAPNAPQYQNDQPVPPQAPAGPQFRNNRDDDFGPMRRGSMGFGIFGIIGGFFRLIFTILFIGFIFMLVRRFVFGRGGWGPRGMGWRGSWNHDQHDVPPHVQEWHRRMHEQPAPAPVTPATDTPATPATDAPAAPATDAPPASDEGKLV